MKIEEIKRIVGSTSTKVVYAICAFSTKRETRMGMTCDEEGHAIPIVEYTSLEGGREVYTDSTECPEFVDFVLGYLGKEVSEHSASYLEGQTEAAKVTKSEAATVLEEKIEEALSGEVTEKKVEVYFGDKNCYQGKSIGKICEALSKLDQKESLELTMGLYELICSSDYVGKEEVFEGLYEKVEQAGGDVGQRFIATHTLDGKEFRVWYALPSHIGSEHVDSSGHGLLIDVKGEPETVIEYVQAWLGSEAHGSKSKMITETGTKLYL
jgi:hypothetical protein